MSETLIFAMVILWLGLGGWACRRLMSSDLEKEALGALFLFCLVLAPFAFGMSLYRAKDEQP